jgi:hypothetical protein
MGEGRPLGELARVLSSHRAAAVDALSGEASLARHELQGRLTRLFRRASLDPAAAVVFLALCALDLERLRGELTARALLPGLAPVA